MTDAFVPLLEPPDDHEGASQRWYYVRGNEVAIAESAGHHPHEERHFLGMHGDVACWAADVPGDAGGDFTSLYGLHGSVDERTWTIAGRAVQLVEWARTHRFCGRCGTQTELANGERAMRCPSCKLLSFPRLAPAIITLVERDGEALLARGRLFAVPMYSCLAGFVEPGETLEEAVHREVREEVGVELADVRYVASQPWPFPHSLMLGFRATWGSGDIVIDEKEIMDARWYRRDALPQIPPRLSIARRLIDEWLDEGA